jgi:hypothetical protein
MAIATKNGVPIIQGGRITTACSCCTPCLPIEERTFRGQQYGDNIYTISVPPQAGQFTFTNVQCGASTGAGATCSNWPITYRVKAGGVVLHEAGCVSSDIVLCKPEGVTSIEVNIFVHQPTGQFAYCLGQISFPRGLARIGCLDTRTGACCNGTTCTVKPQCQCNAAAGEVFKGVGTVCSPNPCGDCPCPSGNPIMLPDAIELTFAVGSLTPAPGIFALSGPVDSHPPVASTAAAAALSEVSLTLAKSALWDYSVNNFFSAFCQTTQGAYGPCCDSMQSVRPQIGACLKSSLSCSGDFAGSLFSQIYCEGSFFEMMTIYTNQELQEVCEECVTGGTITQRSKMSLRTVGSSSARINFNVNLGDPCAGTLGAKTVSVSTSDGSSLLLTIHVAEVPGCPRVFVDPGGFVSGFWSESWSFWASDMTMTITPVYTNPLP